MTMKPSEKSWLVIFVVLFVVLSGFPFLLTLIGMALAAADLGHLGFLPMLKAYNFYCSLPAMVFDDSFFPVEEFGVLPTAEGKALTWMFYSIVAFAISFPINWLLCLARRYNSTKDRNTHST